jgi:acetyltransferase-like isoleucine patch superfamily enzyme
MRIKNNRLIRTLCFSYRNFLSKRSYNHGRNNHIKNRGYIFIGKDCMISSNVHIRTGDSHSILDENGNRINYAKSVNISNHCWVGEGAKILKGVTLDENSVVATGSIVTKSFNSNSLIGGAPAKEIKQNISWNIKRF